MRLARWVGKGQAMRVGMGFPLKAEEAYRIGLAQWLVPHAELMPKAHGSGRAHRRHAAARRAARQGVVAFGMDSSSREAANVDLYRFMALELTEDKKEAQRARRERRKPTITGR